MRKQPMRQGNSNGLLTVIGLGVQSKCSHTCEACLQTLTLPVEAKDKEGKGKNEKKRQAFAHVSTMLPESGSRPFFLLQLPKRAVPESQQRAVEDKRHPQSNKRSEQILFNSISWVSLIASKMSSFTTGQRLATRNIIQKEPAFF